jgi:transposase
MSKEDLHVAFELGAEKWLMVLGVGTGVAMTRDLRAGDIAGAVLAIEKSKEKFALSKECRVVAVYEAGRDGFWLYRWLVDQGYEALVVDSASIKVDRRRKRVKTDRLDACELLGMLDDHESKKEGVWSVVQVPSREDEDLRRLQRHLDRLKGDFNRHMARIRGVLVTYGIQGHPEELVGQLRGLRSPSGEALGEQAIKEIEQEWKSAELVAEHIRARKKERKELERSGDPSKVIRVVLLLQALRSIGPEAAWIIGTELFGWRRFDNRRQVGSIVGLCGAHYSSGKSDHDQGISKAGNGRVRSLIVEVAWLWLRYQPDSAISKWFYAVRGTKRLRRVRIVAVARRLLIALRRWVEFGDIPEGAVLCPKLPGQISRVMERGWPVPRDTRPCIARAG